MARGRFLPLIALVLLGTLVLTARLAVVQIGQHAVWAEEAAGLVRKGRVVPYMRGEIRDRRGEPIVIDRQLYQVEFIYREFRRGHPLGLVAHARSTLEMRAVPLDEALRELEAWGLALIELTPADISAFGRGEGVETELLSVQPAVRGGDMRRGRARDLSFYVAGLVGLDRADKKALRKLPSSRRAEVSYLAFAAERRGVDPDKMRARLVDDWIGGVDLLAELASLREEASSGAGLPVDDGRAATPLGRLVVDLEERRRRVENLAAGDLFTAASGFQAGRVEPAELARTFDLDWLAGRLRWDSARVLEWTLATRREWLTSRDEVLLPWLVLDMERAWRETGRADSVLDELASLYMSPDDLERRPDSNRSIRAARSNRANRAQRPSTWRTFDELAIVCELDRLFAVPPPRGPRESPPVLPIEDPDVRAMKDGPGDPRDEGGFGVLARVESWQGPGVEADADDLARRTAEWRELLTQRRREALTERCKAMLEDWESRFALALEQRFRVLRENAGERVAPGAGLPLARARLDRAQERADYSLIDRGSRPALVVREPTYAVVYLLTRRPEQFRGFGVRQAHRRVYQATDDSGRAVAAGLIGEVRMPNLDELHVQKDDVEDFEALRRIGQRDERETLELEHLVRSIDRPDEWRGAAGLEGYFDKELSGRNGYSESGGLQERLDRRSRISQDEVDKLDGEPLESTLDLELQREAVACLEYPDLDRELPQNRDGQWLAAPTGAIVLMTPDGEVLVAASVPVTDRERADGSLVTRDQARERTLTKPDFQPAGSVFKPFVAAYALDRLGLDPAYRVTCSAQSNDGVSAGYKGLGCWNSHGHGEVDLRAALKGSCNSYFAWLGEAHFTQDDFVALADEFGYGQPTGVRMYPRKGRSGLREDPVRKLFRRGTFRPRDFLAAGNGLGVVEATPMQIARATAGLATGILPDVRLVRAIGDERIPASGRAITLSERSLDRVRSALFAVTNERGGTAYNALSSEELGFAVAAKTGSADLASKPVLAPDGRERVLKHTWVAAWFPPEEPVGVLVVFVHRTIFTSSHNAAWIAAQFLKTDRVQAWLREEGVIE